jgi:hypothetical protein
MTCDRGALITAAVFVVITTVLLIASMQLRSTAALVPLIVAIPTLLILIEQFVRHTHAGDPEPLRPEPELAARERSTLKWMTILLGLIWSAGVVLAIPAYLLLHLRVRSRERWSVAVAVAGAAWGILFAGLGWLLEAPPPPGAVWMWLTRS